MYDLTELLEASRAAFHRRDWIRARDGLLAARARGPMAGDDVFALAEATWWLGLFRESLTYYEEAHHCYLQEGQTRPAVRAAAALGALLMMRGEMAAGSGWMGRAQRLVRDLPECPEHGYLRIGELEMALGQGQFDAAIETARQMHGPGQRHGDQNRMALAITAEGRALIKQGHVREGSALLDEAMLAALSDDRAPDWAGNIYCQLMRVW